MHRVERTSSIHQRTLEPSLVEEIEKKVHQAMTDTMRRVNVKREHRLAFYKKEEDTGDVELSGMDTRGLLSRGILYPQDIYEKKKDEKALIASYVAQRVFYLGMAPKKQFARAKYEDASKKPTKEAPFSFKIKDNVTPSQALDALEFQGLDDQESDVGLSLLSCENVCEYAVLRGLQHALGREKFDALLSSYSRTPLMLGMSSPYNPLHLLIDDHAIRSEDEIKKGDWIYVKNHWSYSFKHPYGCAQGHHVFCVGKEGESKYIGFAIDCQGTTLLDLRLYLCDQLNCEPFEELLVPEDLHQNILKASGEGVAAVFRIFDRDYYKNMTLDHPSFLEKVEKKEAGAVDTDHVRSLRIDRIALLTKLSIPEGKKQLFKWQNELIAQFQNH